MELLGVDKPQGGSDQAAIRSPVQRRAALRSAGADELLDRKGYGKTFEAEQAHPLIQRLRGEQAKVYAALVARRYEKTRTAVVSNETLAELTGLHLWSARRARDELVALGVIEKRPRMDKMPGWKKPGHLANEYYFPRMNELRPDVLLAPIDGHMVDRAPPEDERPDKAELARRRDQAAQLAREVLAPQVRDVLQVLAGHDQALRDRAPRMSRAIVGRTYGELVHEADLRRAMSARAQGKPAPRPLDPDALRAAIDAIGGTPPAAERLRIRAPEACVDALQAQGAFVDAARAVLGARAVCEDVLRQVAEASPRGDDWRHTVADGRIALYLAGRAGELVGRVDSALEVVEASWTALLLQPRPAASSAEEPVEPAKGDGPLPDLARGEWWPPLSWSRREGGSRKRWLTMRAIWDDATARGAEGVLRRLRRTGFREDWPDPPS